MTIAVKNKTPLVVPPAVRRRAGLKSGQEIEFKVCTLEQRRIIDAQLAQVLDDIKHGRTFGPFQTRREMFDFRHAQVKSAAKAGARKS
jgi:bifunctional DNA-binding transcriptional regulator/antitoxin component of YhaV-PrlF toxin-antitoxin module